MAIDWKKIENTIIKVAKEEMDKAADVFQAEATQKVPVLTGDLKISIVKSNPKPNVITVGPKEFYGRFLEFGTVKMNPIPFMRPAFDTKKQSLAKTIEDRLVAEVDKLNNTLN